MIRTIDIRLNAAHPELPLVEAATFTGAPSSVFIRGVPKSVGNWSITAVSVAVTYPDNTTTARAAVESADGVWVATIPGTATSGRTEAGFRILADGIDENGAAVTGYVLGFADFSVLSFMPVPAPGGTFWYLRYFDTMPTTPKEGDVAKVDNVLKFYNGSAWEPFAAPVTLDDAVTRSSANGVKSSGIWAAIWGALSALPTGFTSLYDWVVAQLAGKASTADVTLTERTGTAWVYSNFQAPEGWTLDDNPPVYDTAIGNVWYATAHNGEDVVGMTGSGGEDATSLHLMYQSEAGTFDVHADKIALRGYRLGPDSESNPNRNKFLASEAEAEALRTGKLDKSGGTVTGEFRVAGPYDGNFQVVPEQDDGGSYTSPTMRFGDGAGVVGIIWRIVDGGVVIDVSDPLGTTYRMAFPSASGTLALTSAIPYDLGTPIVIDTASSETVEGETVNYGAATLANRTANIVQVTAALDELRVAFPAATSGKVRDFGLRVEIGTGSAALTAPALVPIAPTGETIKIENNASKIPALADGTATAKGVTLLYFSENAPGVFVVKGEQVEEVA